MQPVMMGQAKDKVITSEIELLSGTPEKQMVSRTVVNNHDRFPA